MFHYLIKKKLNKVVNLKYNSASLKFIRVAFFIVTAFTLHIGLMMYFEHMSLMDAIWLTFTTATTTGYGDISASTTTGRWSTIIFMYLAGLWLFAEAVGMIIEYRSNIIKLKESGNWSWKMENHIVILNVPCNNEKRYLEMLVEQFETDEDFKDEDIIVVTSKFDSQGGLPLSLQKKGIMLVNESPVFESALKSASIENAQHIVIISDNEHDNYSDSKTFDLVHKARELNQSGYLIAECCFDSNRKRIKKAGANAVIKPIRAYPGMIVRALETQGSEAFIEDIMSTNGNQVNSRKVFYENSYWKDIVVNEMCFGTVIGFEDKAGKLIFNPSINEKVTTDKLFFLNRK